MLSEMSRLVWSAVIAFAAILGCSQSRILTEKEAPEHILIARKLINGLDLNNTSYEHRYSKVQFDGNLQSHTDCSGFIAALLVKCYGFNQKDFNGWLGHTRPLASDFHDAIKTQRGFNSIEKISQIEPGDLIAVRYSVRKLGNTGHVMLVSSKPFPLQLPGEWGVSVIDSSHSGHGMTDTRHAHGKDGKDHDGLGEGVLRLYSNDDGTVRAYSWSTNGISVFRLPNDEHLVIGRLILPFK